MTAPRLRRRYDALNGALVAAAIALPAIRRTVFRRTGTPEGSTAAHLVDTALLGTWLATYFAALDAMERRHPLRRDWSANPDQLPAEAAYLLVLSPIEGLVVDRIASRLVPGPGRRAVRGLPLPVRVALGVIVTEFGHYVHHRAAHAYAPLWRFHRVHHGEPRLTWRNATTFHPCDMVPLMLCQELPLKLLGLDAEATLGLRALKGGHGQLQHSNIDAERRGWGAVFSTNVQHRHHHARRTDPDPRRPNYGAVLSLWDRVFATFDASDGTPANVGPAPRQGR